MIRILTILVVLGFLFACRNTDQKQSNTSKSSVSLKIPIDAVFSSKYKLLAECKGDTETHNGKKYYVIDAVIYNNTDDTLKYGCMGCSYDQFFSIKYDSGYADVSKYMELCFSNWFGIYTVPPHDKGKTFRLYISKKRDGLSVFKLGFNLYIVNGERFDYDPDKHISNYIWSEKLKLTRAL